MVIASRLTILKNHFNVLLKQCKFSAIFLICKQNVKIFRFILRFCHPEGKDGAFLFVPVPAASANPE